MIKHIWLKEIKGAFYTWKSAVWLLISSLLFSFTSYLLLTDKELSLLDQTELMWLLSKIIVGVGLLIVTIEASSVLTGEFEKDTAESLLLSPITMFEVVWGKLLFVITLWLLIFLVAAPYIVVASAGSHLAAAYLGYVLLLGTLAALGFGMLILAVSLFFRSGKNTLSASLVLLLALSVPALFPSTLNVSNVAGFFQRINPVGAIFASLDNVLVDYQIHLLQNLQFIIPLLAFCALAFVILMAGVRKFNRKGIANNE